MLERVPDEEMMNSEVAYDVQTGRWLSQKRLRFHVATAIVGEVQDPVGASGISD